MPAQALFHYSMMSIPPLIVDHAEPRGTDSYLKLLRTPILLSGQLAQEPYLCMATHLPKSAIIQKEPPPSRVNSPVAVPDSPEPLIREMSYNWNAMKGYIHPLLAKAGGALIDQSAQLSGTLGIRNRCIVRVHRTAGDRRCSHSEGGETPVPLTRDGIMGTGVEQE
jgi:hypothetical protein